MGLFDTYKKNLTELANAANEKLQAAMNGSQGFAQPSTSGNAQTSDDSHLSSQFMTQMNRIDSLQGEVTKLVKQIDSLNGEVIRLSAIIADHNKQLNKANRQISELEKSKTQTSTTLSFNSDSLPDDFITEVNNKFIRVERSIDQSYGMQEAILNQVRTLAEVLEGYGSRIKRLERNTFFDD